MPAFIQDFVVILRVFALLQILPLLFPVSLYFKNESIEVMRVCLIQGREQQQNWVLGSGVLAPYLDLGFFFPRTSQNVFSVSGTMVSALHWRFIK